MKTTERFLRRANGGDLDQVTKAAIREIGRACQICRQKARPPRRFKLTVGIADLKFNHTVQIETMIF